MSSTLFDIGVDECTDTGFDESQTEDYSQVKKSKNAFNGEVMEEIEKDCQNIRSSQSSITLISAAEGVSSGSNFSELETKDTSGNSHDQ